MTREERLELLKQIEKDIHVCSLESTFLEDAKSCAIHSAIEELEQEPREITLEDVKGYCKPRCLTIITNELLYELTHPKIKVLEQEPKTGHWILTDDNFVYCSQCEDSYYPRPIDASWYFCPHCGAKMEEVKE